MKAFLFAGGRGKRLQPAISDRPKPLAEVEGKTVLERIWDILPPDVQEVGVVVGYMKERIEELLGNEFGGRKVFYIHQEEPKGTGHALKLCEPYAGTDKFLVIYADNLYDREDINNLSQRKLGILVRETPGARQGVVVVDADDRIREIVEWPDPGISDLVVTGAYLLDSRVFQYSSRMREDGEYYINDMLQGLMDDHDVFAERATWWFPVGRPEELERARKELSGSRQ